MKFFHQIENKKTYILENINRSKCSMTKIHENNLTRARNEGIKVLGEGLFSWTINFSTMHQLDNKL
jgi:hypothetical protein